jgi:hypothetical protein
MLFPKFIIENGYLVIGRVTYHEHLLETKWDNVSGGGFWSEENKKVILQESNDFESVDINELKYIIQNNKIKLKLWNKEISDKFSFKNKNGELIEL